MVIRALFAQKALAFYARARYGVDKFDYPFFPDLSYKKFEHLVLRASGNDWLRTMLRDRAFTSLMEGSGLDYQAGRAIAVYLNGEYWGLHNLREKVNEDFLSAKHDVKKSQVTILEANAEVVEGSNEEYLALIDYVSTADPSSAEFYTTVSSQMDIDNYIAYQVLQIFIANEDWPGGNIKFWKAPGTKWRWILYDTDFGFGLYERNVSKNSLEYATAENSMVYSNPPWSTLLLRRLLQNPQFKTQFINYFADQLNSRFLPANVSAVIGRLADEIRTEIPLQKDRWAGPRSNWSWDGEVESLITYANNRPGYVWQHLRKQFALSAPAILSIESLDVAAGSVKVNSVVVTQPNWSGSYFAEVPVTVTALPNTGYRFSHWSGANTLTDPILTLSLTEAQLLTPVFVAD
ncbi:MAG: CotH kinase family protein [Cellvibrionaceae bacterium]|nr:CotH kinase family protein [Cellvibrionaceae bacterium]